MHKIVLLFIISITLIGCTGEILAPVAAGSWFNHDRRTTKAIIDDQTISIKTNLAIARNRDLWKNSHVSTLSYNNSLLLVGQTKTMADKLEVEKIAQRINGVCSIYNQISVSQPIPLSVRSNDTWITTQVKARILSNRNVGMNRVKVITEDGVVYLMGSLTSDEEQTAINIARKVPCVKKVVTVIERQEEVVS